MGSEELDELEADCGLADTAGHDAFMVEVSVVRDLIAAARQAGAGWMPIESAPKDGTAVLAWYPSRVFNGVVARWPIGGRTWEVCWDGDELLPLAPTHWQPLPAPPPLSASNTEGG